jgi:hypothetical protein
MHRFRSAASIRLFKAAALLLGVTFAAAPLSVVLLIRALLMSNHGQVHDLLWVGGVLGAMLLSALMLSQEARCPLCRVAVLGCNGCSKHSKARRLLGSYRLRPAFSGLLKGSFRCPYCGEPVALELRESTRRSRLK